MYKHVIWGKDIKATEKKSNEICISRIIRGEKKEQLRKVPIDDIFNILEKKQVKS